MGLPFFQEPTAADEKTSTPADPTVHRRSIIRRENRLRRTLTDQTIPALQRQPRRNEPDVSGVTTISPAIGSAIANGSTARPSAAALRPSSRRGLPVSTATQSADLDGFPPLRRMGHREERDRYRAEAFDTFTAIALDYNGLGDRERSWSPDEVTAERDARPDEREESLLGSLLAAYGPGRRAPRSHLPGPITPRSPPPETREGQREVRRVSDGISDPTLEPIVCDEPEAIPSDSNSEDTQLEDSVVLLREAETLLTEARQRIRRYDTASPDERDVDLLLGEMVGFRDMLDRVSMHLRGQEVRLSASSRLRRLGRGGVVGRRGVWAARPREERL